MAAVHDSYLGMVEEVTYGTAVAVARFLEMTGEDLKGKYERIDSEAFRAGQRVLHKDRFQPNPKGAEGSIKLEGMDSGLGLLLKHALGSISSGAPTGGFTTHTATVGDLRGKSLTVQVGRVDNAGVLHPFTYTGCKVKGWELSNAVDGVMNLSFDLDSAKENIGAGAGPLAPATPTYSTTAQLFTFVGGVVNIAGAPFGVSDISIKGENKLKDDRWSTVGKREPVEEGLREYSFELKGEFEGLAHAQRVAALLASGTIAAVDCTWASPQGGELKLTIPVGRFDAGAVNFDGAKLIDHALSGMALWDGSASPVSVAYKSKDATP
ncbi:phage tail tube protein [Asanoa sp. WMMD1127]|uniref:phage tail tube protein n=1 Tax=Asanoa sp. WMMD1127 TaxID=3016107 RepID=UPI00241656CD|nr:phage tail tube protein [Asanoa sp. WMMD1127]MDG4826021.1 phage tail tube protein [Asanoa sp. WMMD1127]